MKVTFIALPWIFSKPKFQKHEGFSQHLGIAYLAAYAEKFGHSAHIIDAFSEGIDTITPIDIGASRYYIYGLSPEETAHRIPKDSDIIGISCPFSSQAFLIEAYAAKIKALYPNKMILLGGPHAISHPRESLSKSIDVVVRGEGEIPLIQLLNATDLSDIQGILYKKDDGIVDNGLAPIVKNMDELPFPSRHLLPMEKYFSRSQRGIGEKSIAITTSRGCPYQCHFCALHNLENDYAKTWRAHSPQRVIAEIDHLILHYGKDIKIQFEDDNLLIKKSRAKELFSLLRERNIKWSIHSGVMINLLDDELLRLMKESGCEQLNIALESGNEKVLKLMRKPMSLTKAVEVVESCTQYKINTLAFLMIGYPGETRESFDETMRFLKKLRSLGLKRIAAFAVNPHYGTDLYELCKNKGYLRNTESAIFNTRSVYIETEDFDAKTIAEWTNRVIDLQTPVRAKVKYLLKKLMPSSLYENLLSFYRKTRSDT